MEYEVVITDGCTGFPDQIGFRDMSYCCTIHDIGGSDATLQECLTALDPGAIWWVVLVAVGVLIMKLLRPVYNMCQRFGWLPKTPGSKF